MTSVAHVGVCGLDGFSAMSEARVELSTGQT